MEIMQHHPVLIGCLTSLFVLVVWLAVHWRHYYACATCLPVLTIKDKPTLALPMLLGNMQFPAVVLPLNVDLYLEMYQAFTIDNRCWMVREHLEYISGRWRLDMVLKNGGEDSIVGTYGATLSRRKWGRAPTPDPAREGESVSQWCGDLINGRWFVDGVGSRRAFMASEAAKRASLSPMHIVEKLDELARMDFERRGLEYRNAPALSPAMLPLLVVWGFVKKRFYWPRFLLAPNWGWYPFLLEIKTKVVAVERHDAPEVCRNE